MSSTYKRTNNIKIFFLKSFKYFLCEICFVMFCYNNDGKNRDINI